MSDYFTINTPTAALQFPFDAPLDDVRAAIAEHATTPEARQSALNQWADSFVARERSAGGIGQSVSDAVRHLARGTPVGSWLDEATALTSSAPRDETMAYMAAQDRAQDREGGAVGTGLKVAGGIASAPLSPIAHLARGATMLPQIANMAATGGLYGLLFGAGEGDTVSERGMNALQGGAIGGALGAGAVPVAKGASNLVGYVADKFKGVPGGLADFDPGAVRRVSRAVGDDVPNPADIPALAGRFGPDGMIADIGPNLQGQTGAIARTPGEGKTTVLRTLNDRAAGAGGRIRDDLNRTLGPEINMPRALEQIERTAADRAGPLYREFRQTPIPYTRSLENIVETLRNEPQVLRDARRLANLDNASGPRQFFASVADDGSVTVERVPNAAEWDYIKRALDGLAFSGSASKNDRRIYGGISSRIRSEIDNVLSPDDPAQSVWARARAASGEGIGLTESMESGRTAFSRGISPDEMGVELSTMSGPERTAYSLGSRQDVRDTMGNASTKWGSNEASAARQKLGSEYAREKLALIAGPDNARRLTGRLDTETAFDATREAARGNSITAAAQAAQKEFPNVVDKVATGREIGAQSLTGIGLRGIRALTDALTGGAVSERRGAVARDAARILMAQGERRDGIANALMQYRSSAGMTDAGKRAIDRLLQTLIPSPRQAIIHETLADNP